MESRLHGSLQLKFWEHQVQVQKGPHGNWGRLAERAKLHWRYSIYYGIELLKGLPVASDLFKNPSCPAASQWVAHSFKTSSPGKRTVCNIPCLYAVLWQPRQGNLNHFQILALLPQPWKCCRQPISAKGSHLAQGHITPSYNALHPMTGVGIWKLRHPPEVGHPPEGVISF